MYARYTEYLRDIMISEQTKPLLDKALSTYPLYEGKKKYDLIPTRQELNTKILNHYKYREIGFETLGRFFDELEITMNEIMPYYNEQFKTIEIMADLDNPFDNVDVTETFEQTTTNTTETEGSSESSQTSTGSQSGTMSQTGTGSQTASGTVTSEGESTQNGTTAQNGTNTQTTTDNGTSSLTNSDNSKTIKSETPQDSLSITAADIDNVAYADEVEWNQKNTTGSTTNESTNTVNGTTKNDETTTNATTTSNTDTTSSTTEDTTSSNSESSSESSASSTEAGTSSATTDSRGTVKHTFTKKGNQGVNTYAHDMNEFRTSILDIVDHIINDSRLNELFMLVY